MRTWVKRRRLDLLLCTFCQVSIFLYKSPQPNRSSGIGCSEHQHAEAFCASEETKHPGPFMGSNGAPALS
jgi:hypothetical protein